MRRVEGAQPLGGYRIAIGKREAGPPLPHAVRIAEQMVIDGCGEGAAAHRPDDGFVVEAQMTGRLVDRLGVKEVKQILAPEDVAQIDPLEENRLEEAVLVADHIAHIELGDAVGAGEARDVVCNIVEGPGGLVGTQQDVQRPYLAREGSVREYALMQHPCLPMPRCKPHGHSKVSWLCLQGVSRFSK